MVKKALKWTNFTSNTWDRCFSSLVHTEIMEVINCFPYSTVGWLLKTISSKAIPTSYSIKCSQLRQKHQHHSNWCKHACEGAAKTLLQQMMQIRNKQENPNPLSNTKEKFSTRTGVRMLCYFWYKWCFTGNAFSTLTQTTTRTYIEKVKLTCVTACVQCE